MLPTYLGATKRARNARQNAESEGTKHESKPGSKEDISPFQPGFLPLLLRLLLNPKLQKYRSIQYRDSEFNSRFVWASKLRSRGIRGISGEVTDSFPVQVVQSNDHCCLLEINESDHVANIFRNDKIC